MSQLSSPIDTRFLNTDALNKIFQNHAHFVDQFRLNNQEFQSNIMNAVAEIYGRLESDLNKLELTDIDNMLVRVKDMEIPGLELSWQKPNDNSNSWEPLPAWEKKFSIKVGAMPGKRFVELKNNLFKTDKVFEWDDLASLKAFQEAKQRFWEYYHRFPCTNYKLPSNATDMYIDDIDWNSKIDQKPFFGNKVNFRGGGRRS